jgi:dihydrofolate reductase
MGVVSSVYIATSLDGFIARKNGDLDWLDAASSTATEGEDCGYNSFMKSIDVLVMGRKSFEKVLSLGDWPYSLPVVVLSSNDIEIPDKIAGTVSSSTESPSQLCERLQQEGAKRLYIDGGITIQRFLNEGLIDDMTITVIPIVLGDGTPLFGATLKDIPLKLIASKAYDFGFAQLTYEVVK